MFEISWSELLILGIVTLVFVGPKELPVFMRTLGRYASVVRRHANEFKAQFDAAMREAELELDARRGRQDADFDQRRGDARQSAVRGGGDVDQNRKGIAALIPSQPETEPAAMPPMPAPPRMEP